MRVVLDPEEAWELGRHPDVQETLRYTLDTERWNPVGLPPAVSPRFLVRLLRSTSWMRPSDRVRVDCEPLGRWAALPQVARVRTEREAYEWEDIFRRHAHHRRVLAGDVIYAAATWPGGGGQYVLTVADDGYMRSRTILAREAVAATERDVLSEVAQAQSERLFVAAGEQATRDVALGAEPS